MTLLEDRGAELYRECKAQEATLGFSGALRLPPLEEIRRLFSVRGPRGRDLARIRERKRRYYREHRARLLRYAADRRADRSLDRPGVSA